MSEVTQMVDALLGDGAMQGYLAAFGYMPKPKAAKPSQAADPIWLAASTYDEQGHPFPRLADREGPVRIVLLEAPDEGAGYWLLRQRFGVCVREAKCPCCGAAFEMGYGKSLREASASIRGCKYRHREWLEERNPNSPLPYLTMDDFLARPDVLLVRMDKAFWDAYRAANERVQKSKAEEAAQSMAASKAKLAKGWQSLSKLPTPTWSTPTPHKPVYAEKIKDGPGVAKIGTVSENADGSYYVKEADGYWHLCPKQAPSFPPSPPEIIEPTILDYWKPGEMVWKQDYKALYRMGKDGLWHLYKPESPNEISLAETMAAATMEAPDAE